VDAQEEHHQPGVPAHRLLPGAGFEAVGRFLERVTDGLGEARVGVAVAVERAAADAGLPTCQRDVAVALSARMNTLRSENATSAVASWDVATWYSIGLN
jgi:hypothetical protein